VKALEEVAEAVKRNRNAWLKIQTYDPMWELGDFVEIDEVSESEEDLDDALAKLQKQS
jgi:hypothetical protein